MSDTAEYLARRRSSTQSKDPLELQRQTPALLHELLSNASDGQLIKRPGPNKWSIGEILAHLAEDEIATAWRYRQMVEHSGIELAGFDQDLWADLGEYGSRRPEESLALFRLLMAIRPSAAALPVAVLFTVLKPPLELVVWTHLGGYLLARWL